MKRLFIAALLALSSIAFGATTVPVQLLNPSGSTSGQAIVSTGATSAPAWGGIGVSGIAAIAANTVLANVTGSSASPAAFAMPGCSASGNSLNYTSGTGFTCATGYALTSGATFTNATGVSYASPTFFVNDSTGIGQAIVALRNSGTIKWGVFNASNASDQFAVGRYVAGAFVDNPITISNSTGLVTLGDGVLAAAGAFTTLSTTANDALFYQNSTSQSFASGTAATVTTWTKVADKVNANFNASTGIFTAPATGFYQVSAQLFWTAAANVSGSGVGTYIVANGVTVAQGSYIETSTATAQTICAVSAVVSLAAGQTIVLQGFQNSGIARTLGGVGALSFMSITRIP